VITAPQGQEIILLLIMKTENSLIVINSSIGHKTMIQGRGHPDHQMKKMERNLYLCHRSQNHRMANTLFSQEKDRDKCRP
jgi:hypothetical protein